MPVFKTPLQTSLFLTLLLILSACGKKEKIVNIDPEINKYVAAFTSGVVSKKATIKVQLAAGTKTTHAIGETHEKLFSFSPNVSGKTFWTDARTVEFVPDEPMRAGEIYTVSFFLNKVMDVPKKFDAFLFNIEILSPSFLLIEKGLRSANDQGQMFLEGRIETSDYEDEKQIEKLLQAKHNNDALKISWQHQPQLKTHDFTIQNIVRTNQADSLKLEWNGKSINSKTAGSKLLKVPAAAEFSVLDVRSVNNAGQYISVLFSDQLNIAQNLTGLITVNNSDGLSYIINGSEVKVYLSENAEGDYTVNINAGIENKKGQSLPKDYAATVSFDTKKPSVAIAGRGNILPHEGRLMLPFTAVNLTAVDVSIIKIYENNIPQFFQNNDLAGNNWLRQVATPVAQKTIRLDDDKTLNLRQHQRFTLDIDKFFKAEPGAIYNITIGFRPEYSLYGCTTEKAPHNTDYEYEDDLDDQSAFWSRFENYYPFGYDWENRDNPCYNSYYSRERFESRNIFASNIGIIAHKGAGNTMDVIVTDMLTAEPMSGAEIKFLDYQQQVLETVRSDKYGIATAVLNKTPYLIIVSAGKEKGYLKVDAGSNLPLSRFDIAGEAVDKGVKGFIFGERGVWRPGDSLYISFIEQNEANLPDDHPIEFELINPLGQLYKKLVQTNNSGGYNVFKVATDAAAPTGNWMAKVRAGGATFEKTIKIETIMPNRLKVDIDFGGDSVLMAGSDNSGVVTASWLFGAPARHLRAVGEASFTAAKTAFPNFSNYVFTNPTAAAQTRTVTLFDGALNEDGKMNVRLKTDADNNAPGMMKANLLLKVFEPGGAFSIRTLSLPFSPYKSYVGLKVPEGKKPWYFLTTSSKHTASIVNADPKGNLIKGNTKLEVTFYKVQWRWWWDRSGFEFSNFTQDKYNKLISKQVITATNGKAQWQFSVPENAWGRYLILVKDLASGHITGDVVYMDDPGWQNRNNFDDPTAASMLSFTSDKETYAPGEEVTLTIPGTNNGKGLITITNGSRVLKTWWVDTKAGQSKVSFKVEKSHAPNIYANVALLQPYGQTANDLPIRMYGVLQIKVENNETVLHPKIEMPTVIKPQQTASVTVSEANNKPMWYTIAIVDEGLLGLTNYRTPNPHKYFYAKEALSVKTWDVYDYVIGAWGSNIERILTIGGDEGINYNMQPKGANRFPPVVKFLGPFHLNKGKRKHDFVLPQYAGAVRVMVVAAGEKAYGSTEKTVEVKQPLMVLGTLPRVLSPGEEIQLPVTVFTTENTIKSVQLTLQTNTLLEVKTAKTKQLTFNSQGEQTVFFDVKVKSTTDIGTVKITASSGKETSAYNAELNIRNANPFITTTSAQTIAAGGVWSTVLPTFGAVETNKHSLEISASPPINLQKHLNVLIYYPHGCAEQLTSTAFAQLYLNRLSDLTAPEQASVEKNLKAAIASLSNFQTTDGGFSYWPGQREADDWTTTYIGHFLLLAKKEGYHVPAQMLNSWTNFQRSKASGWAPSSTQFFGADLAQAYRLFTLALANASDVGAMNRLKAFQYISDMAKWRLAAAYTLTGQSAVAANLTTGLSLSPESKNSSTLTYGSNVRDEAMILETLVLMEKKQQAEKLLNKIASSLSQDSWYSTQTTAYALLSIAEFAGKNQDGRKLVATVSINGKQQTLSTSKYLAKIPVAVTGSAPSIKISNQGSNTLFLRTTTSGQPLTGEPLKLKNNPALLKMNVSYMSQNKQPLNTDALQQGTDFIAKITVTNPGGRGIYRRMALTQIMPSGWEILNTRLLELDDAFSSSVMQYQDIRDDRALTYFELKPFETKVFYLRLNAAYNGRFYCPAIICTDMYDETVQAVEEGRWVEVRKSEPPQQEK